MHKWLMEKGKCLKTEMENHGIDNLTKDDLEEAYYYSKILKNLMCIEKDGKIVEAMEQAENEDNMDMIEEFEDYPEKRYYRGQPRNSKGQFMSTRGRNGGRYYTEPSFYKMDMDLYKMSPEEMRRKENMLTGVHYYTEGGNGSNTSNGSMNNNGMNSNNMNSSARRNYDDGWNDGYNQGKSMNNSNSRMERARKNYEEKHDMASLEEMMTAIQEEIKKQEPSMDANQKSMTKSKLTTLVNSIK